VTVGEALFSKGLIGAGEWLIHWAVGWRPPSCLMVLSIEHPDNLTTGCPQGE
jgi:hypothetical protein